MMKRTATNVVWRFATIVLLWSGCGLSQPEGPATKAAAEKAPLAEQAATPTERQGEPAAEQAATPTERQGEPAAEQAAPQGPQLVAPASAPASATAASQAEEEPEGRTVFYRADSEPAEIPPVVLTKAHEALCRVKAGDALPEIALARLGNGGQQTKLSALYGKSATVVLFWAADRRMAREQLADLEHDVVQVFGDRGVTVVGIAVKQSPESAESALQQAGAKFVNLLDRGGEAFAKVGSEKLPRTYLVDPQGKILWFDIEYSLSTRRELQRALRALTEPR
jgi:peroxiredoxin